MSYLESYLGLLSSTMEEFDEDMIKGCRSEYKFATRELFAVAINIVETFGFVPSKSETSVPTKIEIANFYGDPKAHKAMIEQFLLDSETALKKADELIDWINASPETNDFFTNLKTLASVEAISWKYFGYVAGIIPSWMKSIKETKEKETSGLVNEYLDIPAKKRVTLSKLRLINVMAIDGFYGTTYLHTFNDKDGRSIVWFSTAGSLKDDFEEIEERDIVATIKEFKEYKGTKQTIVNRVKLV
jgi:hypothetical protein